MVVFLSWTFFGEADRLFCFACLVYLMAHLASIALWRYSLIAYQYMIKEYVFTSTLALLANVITIQNVAGLELILNHHKLWSQIWEDHGNLIKNFESLIDFAGSSESPMNTLPVLDSVGSDTGFLTLSKIVFLPGPVQLPSRIERVDDSFFWVYLDWNCMI